jgi:ElaB/YqjD/DUF883 family membrane-anchored ribosome-binding protein
MTTSARAIRKNHHNGTSHLSGVIDGAEALVAATADLGEDKIGDLRKQLQHDLEVARDHLGRIESELKGRVTGVDTYVHENPWQAIGMAAAAGIVVGAIAFRK